MFVTRFFFRLIIASWLGDHVQCDVCCQAAEVLEEREDIWVWDWRNTHLTELQWGLEHWFTVEGTTLFRWCIMTI